MRFHDLRRRGQRQVSAELRLGNAVRAAAAAQEQGETAMGGHTFDQVRPGIKVPMF
jgi:hypothetical protein